MWLRRYVLQWPFLEIVKSKYPYLPKPSHPVWELSARIHKMTPEMPRAGTRKTKIAIVAILWFQHASMRLCCDSISCGWRGNGCNDHSCKQRNFNVHISVRLRFFLKPAPPAFVFRNWEAWFKFSTLSIGVSVRLTNHSRCDSCLKWFMRVKKCQMFIVIETSSGLETIARWGPSQSVWSSGLKEVSNRRCWVWRGNLNKWTMLLF